MERLSESMRSLIIGLEFCKQVDQREGENARASLFWLRQWLQFVAIMFPAKRTGALGHEKTYEHAAARTTKKGKLPIREARGAKFASKTTN